MAPPCSLLRISSWCPAIWSVFTPRPRTHVRIAHRHVLHPGRSVRARILAIAADGRRRRRRRRQGGDQNDISQREKEIIAATWKQQTDKTATPQKAADTAKFLSQVQSTLRDQALSLAGRLNSRDLNQQNEEFNSFERT